MKILSQDSRCLGLMEATSVTDRANVFGRSAVELRKDLCMVCPTGREELRLGVFGNGGWGDSQF
jgi:hypothetical protein